MDCFCGKKLFAKNMCRSHYYAQPQQRERINATRRKLRGTALGKLKQAAEYKVWRLANKEKVNLRNKKWQIENPCKYKAVIVAWRNSDCAGAQKNSIRRTLRRRLHHALKGNAKTGSAVRDLGCSIDELKLHLESKFKPGMTWENHSLLGWHIDHIKPLASFDLTNRDELLKAIHYTNLQPLWAEENMKKGSK